MTHRRFRPNRYAILVPAVAVLAAAGYRMWVQAYGLNGFPLDDAWIHQTFARNLAETGQMAFLPGEASAGSTSPAWTFLVSVAYMVGLDARLWTSLLGALALAATGWLTYRLLLRLNPSHALAALLAGLLCAVEWHLVWAAVSGMETVLFAALSLAVMEYTYRFLAAARGTAAEGPASVRREQAIVSAAGIGLLAGLLVVTRPEGLGLAVLALIAVLILPRPSSREEFRLRLFAAGVSLLAMGFVVAPYVAFNLRTSGWILPNTFYAKQAEYQIPLSPVLRVWRVLSPTLAGPQALLAPGFCYAVYRLVRRRQWPALLPAAWWGALIGLYALRLPVAYQHGRYTMPTIPLLVLYGVWGTAELLQPRSVRLPARVLSRSVPAAVALLALAFWVRGAIAYREDVGFIEGELVAMARWLNENTEPGDLIAVHDIGAVGYFTERPLLDLAGLITPDVVPFIADAGRLADWMIARGAAYAVFFPDFSPAYAQLAADPRLRQVTCTDYAWTRAAGHANLCVYRLPEVAPSR